MSFTYFKFLFVNTIKKKSIWITWLLFLFTCTAFIIILPLAAQMNTLQVWANTTMAICQTFMGMVAGLFTAVLAINIFKDTNEDGTELIVISKPISRFKLVMSKFVLFAFYCLLINLTTVVIAALTYFLPRTEQKFYVGLLVSMFIGNLVTFGIFGSISILLSVKFVKVGIIITNIIISLVFLIFQALTLFVFPTPIKELDNQHMSPSTYIIHNRDVKTGEYIEEEVVSFDPSGVDKDKKHPCQATNWREMINYWRNNILEKDPTPVLNVTDLAGQLGLTYMSYKTDEFAQRQAKRMFAWTRFYDYKLTSPASPEITEEIKNKKSLEWAYSDFNEHKIEELKPLGIEKFYLVSSMAFDGIPPLTGTRLRGYADTIPVGSLRSKDQLFSSEVYFEKDQWNKYSKPFDLMYKIAYDYRNYLNDYQPSDELTIDDYLVAWSKKNEALAHYYKVVWACLMGKTDDPTIYISPEITELSEMKEYGPTYFDINNVMDLNARFIQFKNYVLWKAIDEQKAVLSGTDIEDPEIVARQEAYDSLIALEEPIPYSLFNAAVLGVAIQNSGSWMMNSIPFWGQDGLIVSDSQAPALDFMAKTWDHEAQDIASLSSDQQIYYANRSSFARFKKTASIVKNTSQVYEDYLFDSLMKPTRQWEYSGNAYVANATWYPNMNGIAKDILGLDQNIPLGQNMQWFYYTIKPKVHYWVFAVIWGSISAAMFTGGVIVYNKYDVK